MDFYKSSIPTMSTPALIILAQDCEMRIGSHVAGGDPNEEYIQQQRDILSLIQEEMSKRS